ncbi:MAG: LLM class flavin-dependent oxidoreductase [Ilumatobacteraceae bacterium]|nr:LLM class flavin-dependent oxidoreductase [Ilumatobacteraceae bacterium]
MEFIANLMDAELDPVEWAQLRESEGWHVLGCADHFFSPTKTYPHVWVTLAAMAGGTSRAKLTTSFANNLFRSPVEFAQASLQMQRISKGRFEAGLGAGWEKAEALGADIDYPEPAIRAERYIEAAHIVRSFFDTGACRFEGKHYDIDVPRLGPIPAEGAPPLVFSLGGPRTIRHIAPIADRVEVKLISQITRDGAVNLPAMASVPESHLHDLVRRIRDVNPTVPLSVFILCSAGNDERTKGVEGLLADSFLGGFYGAPGKVAASMMRLADAGIDRVEVSPFTEASFSLLAKELF